MKLIALWVVCFGSVIAFADCSVSHRSGDFSCSTQADCATGRTCTDGLCVVSSSLNDAGETIDARLADASTCPAECTSCNAAQKTCTIDCALEATACNQEVTCPTGWSCNIDCSTANSCRNGVSCANSVACTITCSGQGSCQGVTCGTGACTVDCAGKNSCNTVSCGAACACDVTCAGNAQCAGVVCRTPPLPSPQQACTSGRGCSSMVRAACDGCL